MKKAMTRGDLIKFSGETSRVGLGGGFSTNTYPDGKTYVYRMWVDHNVNAATVDGIEWYACTWSVENRGVYVLSGPYPDWKSAIAALVFEKDEYYEHQ